MRMRTASKMTVVCILAILVVAFSSGRYSMVQAAPPVLSHNCTKIGNGVQCTVIEQPLAEAAAGCRDLQANMKNDTADHFYAGLFQQLDCADTLARMPK
jgi:hypothetical protein